MKYIDREITRKILDAQKSYPVTVVTGPRQTGKTELCKHIFPDYTYVNLEDIGTRNAAMSDPAMFIDRLGDKAVLDEIQNTPELLSIIQVRVDENRSKRYVLTGSANFTLLGSISQSLSGRAAVFTLLPFSFREVKQSGVTTNELMFMGCYPNVIAQEAEPSFFYRNYYNTYVEKDVRTLLKVKNLLKFDTFMRILATRCGAEFNASAISRETGVSSTTISEWLSILCSSYITYLVRPYYSNIAKRLTKMPKVYFYDTGLLSFLLGLESPAQLDGSSARGAVFENMAMSELMKGRVNAALEPNLFFYREQSGKEVDALISAGDGVKLYEIKSGTTFQSEYNVNLRYVASVLPNTSGTCVIYDGPSYPPSIMNIRDM